MEIGKLSLEAQLLYERLKGAHEEELIPYSELSEIIRDDVQKKGRGKLYTAMNLARERNGLVFDTVKDIGVRCMNDIAKIDSGRAALWKVRRASRRAIKKMVLVKDFDSLSPDEKGRHNTYFGLLGFISVVTKPKKILEIEGIVTGDLEKLTFAKTLEFFSTRKDKGGQHV